MLAPLVGRASDASASLLLALRLVALAVLAGVLVAYRRLLARVTTRYAASWAPVALLVACPTSGKLFELRADWCALLAVLTALACVEARPRTAGLLLGVALCLTQKAAPLWLGVLAWGAVRRDGRTAHVLWASAVPIVLLEAFFAWHGAGRALFDGTVAVNLHWPVELDWHEVWAANAPAAPGMLVLALAALTQLRTRDEALLAVFAVIGAVAYLVSPVPWEQSLLFLVTPWSAALALVLLGRYTATPATFRSDVPFLAATLLVTSAILPARDGLAAVVVWLVVGIVVRRLLASARWPRAIAAVVLLPGLVTFLLDRVHDFRTNRAAAQAAFTRTVSQQVAPGEAVLTMWDHVLPFHPAATYYWFAHEGVLGRFAADVDAEYVDAVEGGRVRVAILDPGSVAEHLPRFRHLVERRCRLLADGYAGSDAYLCDAERR